MSTGLFSVEAYSLFWYNGCEQETMKAINNKPRRKKIMNKKQVSFILLIVQLR